jgi:hypothetical protein
MLAIGAQGVLFNIGTLTFGRNLLGHFLGMSLLCLWSYIQPVLLYYFMYGHHLFDLGQFYLDKINISGDFFIWAISALILLKISIGLSLVIVAHRMSEEDFNAVFSKLFKMGQKNRVKSQAPTSAQVSAQKALRNAAKDVFKPLFILSILLNAFFLISLKLNSDEYIWLLLRPIAIGFFLFFSVHWIPLERMIMGHGRIARGLRAALQSLRGERISDLNELS